jgi:7-cyano-7-deazaguanine synthase in queuosine biosynthesis
VLPEDDSNRQIANGFILNSNVNEPTILELIRSTWSCIHDSDTHCGMCEGYLSTRKAVEQAGISDPAL